MEMLGMFKSCLEEGNGSSIGSFLSAQEAKNDTIQKLEMLEVKSITAQSEDLNRLLSTLPTGWSPKIKKDIACCLFGYVEMCERVLCPDFTVGSIDLNDLNSNCDTIESLSRAYVRFIDRTYFSLPESVQAKSKFYYNVKVGIVARVIDWAVS